MTAQSARPETTGFHYPTSIWSRNNALMDACERTDTAVRAIVLDDGFWHIRLASDTNDSTYSAKGD